MSWNNITPWWLIELEGVIARAKVHQDKSKAKDDLDSITDDLPEHVYRRWLDKFNLGEFE